MNPTTFAWAYLLIVLAVAGVLLFIIHAQLAVVLALGALGCLPVFPIVKELRDRNR